MTVFLLYGIIDGHWPLFSNSGDWVHDEHVLLGLYATEELAQMSYDNNPKHQKQYDDFYIKRMTVQDGST